MAEKKAKRYYWLKLQDDFFRDKTIKKLRKIAGGDTYTIIYLKLMLLSLEDNGRLFFDKIDDSFCEELALEIDEDEENVKITVNCLIHLGLLEEISEDEYFLNRVPEATGTETDKARLMRRLRDNRRLQAFIEDHSSSPEVIEGYSGLSGVIEDRSALSSDINGNNVTKALPTSYTEIDIYKEKESNIDIERESKPKAYDNSFEEFWKHYPKKADKKKAEKIFLKIIKSGKVTTEQLIEAVEKQKKSVQWQDVTYIPNATTWLNNDRWEDELKMAKQQPKLKNGLSPEMEHDYDLKELARRAKE